MLERIVDGLRKSLLSSNRLGFVSVLCFDTDHSQEFSSFLPARDERVAIDFNQAL